MSQLRTVRSTVTLNDILQVVREVARQEMKGFIEKLSTNLEEMCLDSNYVGAGAPKSTSKIDHGD